MADSRSTCQNGTSRPNELSHLRLDGLLKTRTLVIITSAYTVILPLSNQKFHLPMDNTKSLTSFPKPLEYYITLGVFYH
jgi:hypothetical protein